MNREESYAIELNDFLATEVMGWTLGERLYFNGKEDQTIAFWYDSPETSVYQKDDWNPCRDAAQAEMVRQKMLDDGYTYSVTLDGIYICQFRNTTVWHHLTGEGGLEAHALCLAAREALIENSDSNP